MRRLPRIALAAALLAMAAAVFGAAARPATAAALIPWFEGVDGNAFSLEQPVSGAVSVLGGPDDERLELTRKTLTIIDPRAPMWDFWPSTSSNLPDPRMVYPLADGNLLVSGGKDTKIPYVMEVDRTGVVTWEYRNGVDGLLRKPFSAEPATFGGRSCVLISDRIACRVFAVDRDTKEVVWQYGMTDVPGNGVNQLADPFCATQIAPNGNVLIADSNDNHRVIEVRVADYDPGPAAVDMGYTAGSIVWQYGVTGQLGTGPGHLDQARSPQRLRQRRHADHRRRVPAHHLRPRRLRPHEGRQRLQAREHRLAVLDLAGRAAGGSEHGPRTSRAARSPGPCS